MRPKGSGAVYVSPSAIERRAKEAERRSENLLARLLISFDLCRPILAFQRINVALCWPHSDS